MATEDAKRDANRNVTILLLANDSSGEILQARIDPSTYRLLVNSTITGSITIAPLSTVYNGSKTVPTGTAEALASSQSISSVTIKALSTNTAIVYVGATGATTSNGFELLAGESVSLEVDDLANIYVISGSASQVVRYIAC
jgi:hypothetical protein